MVWNNKLGRNADKPCCQLSFRRALERDFIAHTMLDAAGCVNLAQRRLSVGVCEFACGIHKEQCIACIVTGRLQEVDSVAC